MKTVYAVRYTSKRKKSEPDIFGEWELLNSFIVGDFLFSDEEDARTFMKKAFPSFIEAGNPLDIVIKTEDLIEVEENPGVIIKKRVEIQALYANLLCIKRKEKRKWKWSSKVKSFFGRHMLTGVKTHPTE